MQYLNPMRQIVLFIFLFISIHSFSQKMTISGNVQDTVSKMPLKNAVAMAIRMKDSVLLAHSRTDSKGYFTLSNLQIDTVQIIISDSRFSEQSFYVFGSTSNYQFDFGRIVLPAKSQQLGEVIIYAYKDPVYYKGDTLIYTADSFKVKPNATVEDLLKKLPGIKVDASGKITSQGKEVSQVLVDGDEFFGSDPTVATKNAANTSVGNAILSTWNLLLDDGSLQKGEEHLAGTQRPVVAHMSEKTANDNKLENGEKVTISNSRGSITIKLEIIEMVNDVVWIPSNNHDSKVKSKLGAKEGDVVTIKKGSF